MISLSEMLLPASFLIHCLNAALASVVACAIAVVLSRCSAWSLPARHAILALAVVASLLAPLAVSLIKLPSFWAIQVGEIANHPAATVEAKVTGGIHSQGESPLLLSSDSIPVAESHSEQLAVGELEVVPPASVVLDPIPLAPVHKQAPWETREWARFVGTLLCGFWLVGIAVGATRAVLCLVKLGRWAQTVALADSPLLAAAARAAVNDIGLQEEVTIYRSTILPAPVTFGLFRPRIVVPDGIESQFPPDQLCAVIKHEMAHLGRRDLWIALLQQLVQITYWWNPLVHMANRQLADLREQICDEIAIRELPEPGVYAATLLKIAEQCSLCASVPATLGFGSSRAGQLENRIRRILSSPRATYIRLSRRAAVGVLVVAAGMTATILFGQVQIKPSAAEQPGNEAKAVPAEVPRRPDGKQEKKEQQDPSLHDLIQHIAAYERIYLPFDIKAMETFRFPDDLTPRERARNFKADGRKHQRLMEYAQLERQIWRRKETSLVDDMVEQEPHEQFSDGERIVQISTNRVTFDGAKTLEYHINNRMDDIFIFNYMHATPLYGVFCLSSLGASELFSEVFKADEEGVDLAWDKEDAKLTFGYGKPDWNMKFVLWLSRDHAWHPIRLQRFWDANDELFHDEWEVTQFVQRGKVWRVAEGTHRFRDRGEASDRSESDGKIAYSIDFKILEEKYGSAVDEKQFQVTIPAGAKVRDDNQPEAEPPPPAKTREIKVTVVDVAGNPIPHASVRFPANHLRDLDVVTTDENGVARSAKVPADKATVHVQIAAASYRPVTWSMGAGTSELRAIMVPLSPGVGVDEGKLAEDAWITNKSIQIRADGFTYVPERHSDLGADDWGDWSDEAGRFELKTNLTLRRPDVLVPFIAVDQSREKMAIRFVPARELGQKQELVLQRVCHVHGHSLLPGVTENVEIDASLESAAGEYIGFLSTRRKLTPEGLRVDFEMRLPPGDYVLKSRPSSHHAGFTLPFQVPENNDDLDLGAEIIPTARAVALRGDPTATGSGNRQIETARQAAPR